MKKHILGKKLGRNVNQRKALFKGLMSSFILSDRIQTTEAKAKAIRPQIEKLVTKAKSKENSARRVLEKSLNKEAFERIIKDVAPAFANRNGGYTRLTKIGNRLGDNTTMVLLDWTEVITRTPLETKLKPAKLTPKTNSKKTKKVNPKPKAKTTKKKTKK